MIQNNKYLFHHTTIIDKERYAGREGKYNKPPGQRALKVC